MRKMWSKIFGIAALAFMLCLTGLVMSGEAQAQRFTDNGNGTVTDTVTNLTRAMPATQLSVISYQLFVIRKTN